MSLAISEDHQALVATVHRWAESRSPVTEARAWLDAKPEDLPGWPACWDELVSNGWLALAVSEANGGQGYGLAEQALVLEELGRAMVPGPILPTVAAGVVLDRWGWAPDLVRRLVDGTEVAGLGMGDGVTAAVDGDSLRLSGAMRPVLGGAVDGVVLLAVDAGGRSCWAAARPATAPLPGLDGTRAVAEVRADGVVVGPDRWFRAGDRPRLVIDVLACAEAIGVAAWCVTTAADHARERRQFGRPIGQFQAVKHRCADMLVTLETARAAVWDAARALDENDGGDGDAGVRLAVDAALALAPQAAFACAKDAIQVLGGIGYTWEHDAHLYLKRATVLAHLLDPPADARQRVALAAARGVRRELTLSLPPEAEAEAGEHRTRVRSFVAELRSGDSSEWNRRLADGGYQVPHWPAPWGLDASPVQQLVIDQELAAAGIRRPHIQIAGWVLPTVIDHGTATQQERWVGPSLRAEVQWCQLFSEPGAGSDLASLSTRADRVPGGWSITGQKVWTTLAQSADWGLCLARTDPGAPKHDGIGCFCVDMSTDGIDVRPLRELTGMAMFNEVFFDEVFVPDDCVIGSATDGWACARTTLANERVSMASGSSFGPGVAALFELAKPRGLLDDPLVVDRLGALIVDAHAQSILGLRSTLRAVSGGQPGPEASVRKLFGVEHEQAVQEMGLRLLGPDAAVAEGAGARWSAGFLGNRALSIAGGTSEIQRNVIAERLLDLPKDP